MSVMPRTCPECGAAGGERHAQACSFERRIERAGSPLVDWLTSLPAEYERLKSQAGGCAPLESRPNFHVSLTTRGAPSRTLKT